jgi:hypothetical protein
MSHDRKASSEYVEHKRKFTQLPNLQRKRKPSAEHQEQPHYNYVNRLRFPFTEIRQRWGESSPNSPTYIFIKNPSHYSLYIKITQTLLPTYICQTAKTRADWGHSAPQSAKGEAEACSSGEHTYQTLQTSHPTQRSRRSRIRPKTPRYISRSTSSNTQKVSKTRLCPPRPPHMRPHLQKHPAWRRNSSKQNARTLHW